MDKVRAELLRSGCADLEFNDHREVSSVLKPWAQYTSIVTTIWNGMWSAKDMADNLRRHSREQNMKKLFEDVFAMLFDFVNEYPEYEGRDSESDNSPESTGSAEGDDRKAGLEDRELRRGDGSDANHNPDTELAANMEHILVLSDEHH
ncbi:unnamed protein product [Oppiella nova]|uniref:Uncharacterized protein n=1 Tax=Oppiella nova TaxID=334625 RepID=A0A7R9M847_9ACAR|nr:unnamed protein product [Oppiella nova]CAG2172559.1 unnamed protein product [Oppiella nova]